MKRKIKRKTSFAKVMESWYRDQAMTNDTYAVGSGLSIFAAYTPHGIRMLDAEFIRRIIAQKENPKTLAKEIRDNPHLHPEIKKNLLYNIKIRGI